MRWRWDRGLFGREGIGVVQYMRQELAAFQPDLTLLNCSLCLAPFRKPATLACGHSFCHSCLLTRKYANDLVPTCPSCGTIIWRPLSALKENVALSNLLARYNLLTPTDHPRQPDLPQQFRILIDCSKADTTPLPCCSSHIEFATAFIDEILEQQSQNNHIVLRWPHAEKGLAITGRLMRPEIHHYSLPSRRPETHFRAQFVGRSYVRIVNQQSVVQKPLQGHPAFVGEDRLQICKIQEIAAVNPLPMETFAPFFELYDRLNNPIYIRQIAQLCDERIFHERNDPQKIIYCIMRVLRLPQSQLRTLAQTLDDSLRWLRIEQFLIKQAGKLPQQIIRLNIPGNYPHGMVFAILVIMIVIGYLSS